MDEPQMNAAQLEAQQNQRLHVGPTWFQTHPSTVDRLVVAALFIYNLPIQFGSIPEGLWIGSGVLVSLGLCLPYLLRRRFPLRAHLAVQLVAGVQLVMGISLLPADIVLLLTVYAVAAAAPMRISALSAGVTAVWVVAACAPTVARGDMSVGDAGVIEAAVLWAWTWGRLVRIRRRYISSLHERAAQLEREKAIQSAMAASQERTRIARELHDVVSHSLSVAVVMSDGAASTIDQDPEQSRRAMIMVRDVSRTALADMRRMLGVLRDDEPGAHAPQPGLTQLPGLVEQSRAAGLPVRFTEEGERTGDTSPSVDLTVYRIVQEALTNVRKHAGAVTDVSVTVRHLRNAIEVSITDDGNGPVADSDEEARHGLVGMRERVATHHGQLRTGPRPKGGYEVVATIPTGDGS